MRVVVVVVAAAAVAVAVAVAWRRRAARHPAAPPLARPWVPLLGNALAYRVLGPARFLARARAALGPVFALDLAGFRCRPPSLHARAPRFTTPLIYFNFYLFIFLILIIYFY